MHDYISVGKHFGLPSIKLRNVQFLADTVLWLSVLHIFTEFVTTCKGNLFRSWHSKSASDTPIYLVVELEY